jgi:hypothetical protein
MQETGERLRGFASNLFVVQMGERSAVDTGGFFIG